ncbi:MAG: GGDEF domain-containing protein [Pseudomonadota bacterium]
MKLRKLTLEEQPPILLALSGVLGIGPMAVYRLIEGSYAVAALDTVAVIGFVLIMRLVYVKRSVRLASACMAMVAIVTAVISVSVKGGNQIIWMYPATIALFYLLKPREAAITAVVAIMLIMPVVFEGRSGAEVAVFLTSLGVTISLSIAFAVLTAKQRRELHAITLTDPLTGAGNRRALDQTLDRVIDVAGKGEKGFVLIMVDLDHFKIVNDSYGHTVGDTVLCDVAQAIQANIRPDDSCFRAGGEEFVVVAAMADLEQARKLAERLRVAISELRYGPVGELAGSTVTASFGLAEYHVGESRDGLYKRADDALYEAKRRGRNRLHSCEQPLEVTTAA